MPLPPIDLTTATDMELVVLASRIAREQDTRRKRAAAEDALRATVQNLLSAGGDPAAILASLEASGTTTPSTPTTTEPEDAETPSESAPDHDPTPTPTPTPDLTTPEEGSSDE